MLINFIIIFGDASVTDFATSFTAPFLLSDLLCVGAGASFHNAYRVLFAPTVIVVPEILAPPTVSDHLSNTLPAGE